MTSNAAATPPATTAAVPSPRGDESKAADASLDEAGAPNGSENRDHHPEGTSTRPRTNQVATHTDTTDGADASAAATAAASDPASDPAATDPAPVSDPAAAREDPADVATLGPDPAGLHGRLVEARERLRPEAPTIPAPRSPQGVAVPPSFGAGHQPKADIVAAIDQVVAELAAVRATSDEPAHHALVRLGELAGGEIPDAGWSREEGLAPDVVAAAADLAAELHAATSALLERLDAEELLSPAVVVDSAATSLQVMRMVADLEVFARSRG